MLTEEPKKGKKSKSVDKYVKKQLKITQEEASETLPEKQSESRIVKAEPVDSYENIVNVSAERLDLIYDQLKITKWGVCKAIYEIVQSAAASFERTRGKPKKGKEGLTLSRVYKDLSKKSAHWSANNIKHAHLVYERVLAVLNNDHDRVLEIKSDPSCVEAVVLSNIDEEEKHKLVHQMLENRITRQDIRCTVNAIKDPATSGMEIFHTNLWISKSYDTRYGIEGVPGRTPGQIIYNFFYHFVKDSAQCAFPFFGSGTEGDVAKELSCPFLGWDVDVYPSVAKRHKNFVVTHNSISPWPVDPDSNDVVFMDPPRIFHDDGFSDNQDAVGEDMVNNYFTCLGKVITHATTALRVGGVLGLLLRQPYASEIPMEDFTFLVHNQYLEPSLEFVRRIAVTFPRGIREPSRSGMLADGFLDLLVYEKR